jgi:V8-like Glu-specific endopeptidase/endonuclease/exonuclease/phosphatase family metal-dependent hydrolase
MAEMQQRNLSMEVPFAADDPRRGADTFASRLALPAQLEITIGRDNKLDFWFLEAGAQCGQSVCKLETSGTNYRGETGRWSGTGWLIGPDLLLTNHHVLNNSASATAASAIFSYETDRHGGERVTRRFRLDPARLFITHPVTDASGKPGLDFSIVAIDPAAADAYGHVHLVRNPGPARIDDPANVIQHPNGGPKQVTLQDNRITRGLGQDVVYVHYDADTEPGSSGAPVFFNNWAPFALHHAARNNGNGSYSNEGILLTAIAAHLETMVQRGEQVSEATRALACFQGADPMMGTFGSLGRPQGSPSGVEAVVDAFRGEAHDLDVGFWNIEWFNKHWRSKVDAVARLVLEMNLDIWGLSETSREATEALRDRLNQFPGVRFECLASAPDASSSLQNTAVLWNTRTVHVTRQDWPAEVEAWLRLDSREFDQTGLEAVDGRIFDRYPALYKVQMKRGPALADFDAFLVPLHLKAKDEGSKRRTMASKILAAAMARTSEQLGETDWIIGGDYNAELASGDFDALRGDGMVVMSAADDAAGAFSYAKAPRSLIDHIFITSDVQAQFGATDFFIVAKDKTVADYVKSVSDHRPIVARFQLRPNRQDTAVAPSTMPAGLHQTLAKLYGADATATDASDASPEFHAEALPDDVVASMRLRDERLRSLPPMADGMEFVVDDMQAWTPGQTLRVAFLGGSTELHRYIADACRVIQDSCNIQLDFGLDPTTGRYRTWSTGDAQYRAEIRVSFDQIGYFSLVGTDSIAADIGAAGSTVGGRPGQRSLNLARFDVNRPQDWKGTVRHEFLHALAFHHEHQNLRGPCQQDFRWEDDAGYVRTKNVRGVFVNDAQGRRPGIYTYLSGAPNRWERPKVDFNLRSADQGGLTAGPFDPASAMLYRFPPLFYRHANSPCMPTSDGQELSAGDIAGLQHLYPATPQAALKLVQRKAMLLACVNAQASTLAPEALGPETGSASTWETSAAATLRSCLAGRL